MAEDTNALIVERDRIVGELTRLDEKRAALEKQRAALDLKTEAAAGDVAALAKINIEASQLAEAKRLNDQALSQATKRLEDIEEVIAMQGQSGMT